MTWRHSTDSAEAACESCLACGRTEGHASWCGPDYLSIERVEVHGTSSTPEHMLDRPMLGAYRDPDLNAAKPWTPPKVQASPLTDDEREWVHDRMIALEAERQARGDAHRERIRTTAAWLGREVSAHKVTLADADRRIDRLLIALDPETAVPILMLPFREAKQIATDAFASTFKGQAA
jgi:hypothetical protein